MTPHASRFAASVRSSLLAGAVAALCFTGCGGGGGGGSVDAAITPSDANVKKDTAVVSTGGTQGAPDVGVTFPGTGGASGTGGVGGSGLDGGGGTTPITGLDAAADKPVQIVDGGPDLGSPDLAHDTPLLTDGAPDANTTEAPAPVDGGLDSAVVASCQSPSMAKSTPAQKLLTVAWDKNNQLVTGGYFIAATDFLGKPITNKGSADMFVAGVDPATGNATWVLSAGDNQDQYVTQVATSSTGVVGMVGNFTGSLNLVTGSTLINATSAAIDFIAGVDGATGTGTWATKISLGAATGGSVSYGRLNAIAGNVGKDFFVVCGTAVNNAPALVTGASNGGGQDVVVAAIKASDGTVLWGKLFGGAMDQTCTAAAIDDTGNVLIAGQYAGALDFGNGALTPAPTGTTDHLLWVAKLDGATGATLGAQGFGSTGNIFPSALATDAQGNLLVGGRFGSAFTAGAVTLTPVGTADAFVLKLSGTLAPTWARRWGSAGHAAISYGVSSDSAGDVVAAGAFQGTADVGPGSATLAANSQQDIFIVGLDGASGTTTCAHHYGDSATTANQSVTWVSVNRWSTSAFKNSVAAVGAFLGTIDFGQPGTTLTGGGASNPYDFVLVTTP